MSEKRLYRVEEGKMVSGVCGGLARYFGVDPTIVRLVWAAVAIASVGTGLIAYLAAATIIPKDPGLYQ